jgi:hypothetical protein
MVSKDLVMCAEELASPFLDVDRAPSNRKPRVPGEQMDVHHHAVLLPNDKTPSLLEPL